MASDRPVLKPRRLALFLLLVLLLALLLEMNRWLPGGWPGGGGESGFRVLDVAAGTDPERLTAPTVPGGEWKPEQGVRIEVRAPDGTPLKGWRAAVGGRSALSTAEGETLRLIDRDLMFEGLRVEWRDGQVRHVPPARVPPSPVWRIQAPSSPPAPLLQPQPLVVEVTDALSGHPLEGARVFGPGSLEPVVTDAEGRAALKGLTDRAQVRVAAAGHVEALAYGHPGTRDPVTVRLAPKSVLRLSFVDPVSGVETPITAARLLDAQGGLLWESPAGAPRTVAAPLELPADRLDDARFEIDAPGRPRTFARLPERGGRVVLAPAGRALDLTLREPGGGSVTALAATVRYPSPLAGADAPEQQGVDVRVPAGADGRLRVNVPDGVEALVVVEGEGHAPAALRVDPGDSAGPRDIVLAPGIRVPVRVVDARGRPVRDARVIARSVVDGVRASAEARTDAEGVARVGPMAPGSVELFAHAPGKAWGGKTETAASAMGRVELRLFPGAPLRLVVETAVGVPLEGVHVTATPLEEAPGEVQPPDALPWRTGADGALLVEDLPVHSYRLRVALPGYADETLHDVRPGAVTYFATLTPTEGKPPPR